MPAAYRRELPVVLSYRTSIDMRKTFSYQWETNRYATQIW